MILENRVPRWSNRTFPCGIQSTPFVLWALVFGGKPLTRAEFANNLFSPVFNDGNPSGLRLPWFLRVYWEIVPFFVALLTPRFSAKPPATPIASNSPLHKRAAYRPVVFKPCTRALLARVHFPIIESEHWGLHAKKA
jgi:hypothetical protein